MHLIGSDESQDDYVLSEAIQTHSFPIHLTPQCNTCNNGTVYFPFQVFIYYRVPGKATRSLHSVNNYYVVSDEHPVPLLYIGLSADKVGKAVYSGTVPLKELEGNATDDWNYRIQLLNPIRVKPEGYWEKL